ncbi:hypothetical protein TNCV_3844411 [Trichonephila clavipes]|nr:hypothetical protein TNCV_3844411 [Trichonephila clavipes]
MRMELTLPHPPPSGSSPGATEDSRVEGPIHVKSIEAQCPPVGVVVRREVPARVPRHLTEVQKDEVGRR